MPEPTVSAGFARGLFELALKRGADRRALLEAAGVDAAQLADQDARLPFSAYVALMQAAKRLTGDPALALHYGEGVDISEVSVVGLIGLASTDMLEGFRQLNRFVPLIVETQNEGGGDRFQLRLEAGLAWVIDARQHADAFPELSESAFAQLICGPRRHGVDVAIAAVHFTQPDPGYRAEAERIFRAPVTYGSNRNAFALNPAWTTAEVKRLPRYAFGVLTGHAEALLAELEAARSLRSRVERALLPGLHTGEAGMDAVARELGMSRQTLFRRLKAEGVTYERILDDLRRRMALHYLAGRKVSVAETAYLTGFSDPAAFSRAFKRWTGRSPSEARTSPSASRN